MVTGSSTTSSAPEAFLINPHAVNINPSLAEDSKLRMKATKGLPRAERVAVSMQTGYLVRRDF